MLHHHTTAHYINSFAREIATRAHIWIECAHVELLHHLEAEIDQFGAFVNLMEIIANIHTQPSCVDRCLRDAVTITRFVNDLEQFLHTPKGKYRDEATAAALKNRIDLPNQTVDFALA